MQSCWFGSGMGFFVSACRSGTQLLPGFHLDLHGAGCAELAMPTGFTNSRCSPICYGNGMGLFSAGCSPCAQLCDSFSLSCSFSATETVCSPCGFCASAAATCSPRASGHHSDIRPDFRCLRAPPQGST